jgi:hypothetical protein
MFSGCSPSTQVKAAAAHVRKLKQNQQKKKLILSIWVFSLSLPVGVVAPEYSSQNRLPLWENNLRLGAGVKPILSFSEAVIFEVFTILVPSIALCLNISTHSF